MAKQTFSVGQVLTAAQMTSLQQTAMLGGSATAKTASYTLVAADAGTVVSVNSTSATTITVNTGLFSAGDTVTIQNWGSGAVTITAGTATVNTAGSLIVPQYDGGVLYFTSASAAIYFDWVQAGATSPLTTKGDIWGYGTSDARIPIGTNGHVLTADSAQTLGLKWAAPGGASGLTLVKRASFTSVADTGTTFDDVFTTTYKSYLVNIESIFAATSGDDLQIQGRYTGATTQAATYYAYSTGIDAGGNTQNTASNNASQITLSNFNGFSAIEPIAGQLFFHNVGNGNQKLGIVGQLVTISAGVGYTVFSNVDTARNTYMGFLLKSASSNITGTVSVYGLATA